MFTLYAELISFHLQAIESLRLKEQIIKKQDIQLEAYGFASSHDLQEPLRKIQTFSNIIREKEGKSLTRNANKYFKGIEKEADKLRSILQDLLNYAEAEDFSDHFESTNLTSTIEIVMSRLADELSNAGGKLSIVGNLCTVRGIPNQLEQLFYGLFKNSIAFKNPQHELSIRIGSILQKGADFNIKDLDSNTTYCEVTVADNGMGFDQRYSERIFRMFERLGNNENNRSTGIGLAIAKRIVGNHHGKIMAHGIVGQGATFKIYLPFN